MTDSHAFLDTAQPTGGAREDTEWTWTRGGNATVCSSDGNSVTVHSTLAFPPGAPLVALSACQTTFEMKVRTCRKLASGYFEISGKLVNATRPLRERLVAAVGAKDAAQR